MKRAAAWLVRAVGLYLAWDIAYLVAVGASIDEPEPSLIKAFLPGIVIGLVTQAGLIWSPSARGFWRLIAALLMIPSGALLILSAMDEAHLALIGRMHDLPVALTYFGGGLVYLWQFVALVGSAIRENETRVTAQRVASVEDVDAP